VTILSPYSLIAELAPATGHSFPKVTAIFQLMPFFQAKVTIGPGVFDLWPRIIRINGAGLTRRKTKFIISLESLTIKHDTNRVRHSGHQGFQIGAAAGGI